MEYRTVTYTLCFCWFVLVFLFFFIFVDRNNGIDALARIIFCLVSFAYFCFVSSCFPVDCTRDSYDKVLIIMGELTIVRINSYIIHNTLHRYPLSSNNFVFTMLFRLTKTTGYSSFFFFFFLYLSSLFLFFPPRWFIRFSLLLGR